ncbi:hypothetical protein [Bathymodiolus platifrons methanotrophic gill symbiont]|uniref:hypothetical protein n=1 Tax=Bathymodiolus platifrons methanotrophic gill symbiont TaxID=113268 RepID=UPI001C8D89B6|nr:hypothetical protein [Bathymodiolus platifrons methanotrophic gill symbiont]
MFVPAGCIKKVMDDIVSSISRNHQKLRPGRSYIRKSKKPVNKWRRRAMLPHEIPGLLSP